MKEYMMIFRSERNNDSTPLSAEEMEAAVKPWQEWIRGIAANGKYSGTNRLLTEGKTVRPGNVVTDGPYVEAKEIIGGYLIVRADLIEEVIEMAKNCPNLSYGGNVEIRTVMPIEYETSSKDFLT